MQDYYEELWERLPADAEGPDLALRRDFALAEARPTDRGLDLGCGAGTLTAALAGAGVDVIGADVADAALRRARRRHPGLEFQRVPIGGELPFADGAFDLVWSSEVIEHVADTARWLSEVRRVLDRNGRLLLTTPNHSRIRFALHGVPRYSHPLGDHLHLYTRASLADVLDGFGFQPVTVDTAGGVPGLRRLLLARAVR